MCIVGFKRASHEILLNYECLKKNVEDIEAKDNMYNSNKSTRSIYCSTLNFS